MKLVDLTWTPYRVPFRVPFRTARGSLGQRAGALVTVNTDERSTGIGEIAPLPEQSGAGLDSLLGTLAALARDVSGRELTEVLAFLKAASEEEVLPSSL